MSDCDTLKRVTVESERNNFINNIIQQETIKTDALP